MNNANLSALDLFGKSHYAVQKFANRATANADVVLLCIAHKSHSLFPVYGNRLIDEHRNARREVRLGIFVMVFAAASRYHNAVNLTYKLVVGLHYGNTKFLAELAAGLFLIGIDADDADIGVSPLFIDLAQKTVGMGVLTPEYRNFIHELSPFVRSFLKSEKNIDAA